MVDLLLFVAMIFRRIFFVGAFLFLVIWFAIFWVISVAGPTYISQKAATKGVELSIEKIHSNYFHKITLHNLHITKPIEARISRARFSFRPWEFVHTGHVFFLDLKEPIVHVPELSMRGQKKSFGSFLFRMRIRSIQGQISVTMGDKEIRLERADGYVDMGPLGIFGQMSGEANNAGLARIRFSVPSILKAWSARVTSDSLDIGRFIGNFLEASSNVRDTIEKIGNVSVDADINSDRVNIKTFQFMDGIMLKGTIKPPWNKPFLDLKLSGQKKSLHDLLALATFSPPSSLSGDITFETTIQGPFAKPFMTGTFSSESRLGKFQFPELMGHFSYRDGLFQSSSTFSSGTIGVTNTSKQSSAYLISVRNLDIARLAEKNGWENVQGVLSTNMNFNPHLTPSGLKGRFELKGFQWGRIRSSQVKIGQIELNSQSLNFQTDDGSLRGGGSFSSQKADLNDFHFRFGNNSSVSASGLADFQNNKINLTVSGENIPPDLWPPLVAQYPEIQGALDFSGGVSGSVDSPQANLNMSFHKLKFLSGGGEWSGAAQLVGNKTMFALNNISVEGGYTGNLERKNGVLSFDGNLTEASPALMRDVMKKSFFVSGAITGPLKMSWNGENVTGTAAVDWSNGQVGEFVFDTLSGELVLNKNDWNLNQMHLIKGGSAIRLEAHGRTIKSGWSYQTTLQLQQWGRFPLVLDGEIISEGIMTNTLDMSGRVESSTLWVQNTPLENFSANFRKIGEVWSLKGKAAEDVQFEFGLNQKNKIVRGNVNATEIPIGNLFEAFVGNVDPTDRPTGKMSLQGQLSGGVEDPLAKVKLQLKEGEWKGQSLTADMDLTVNHSSFTILPSIVKFGSGGQVHMTGQVLDQAVKAVSLEGNGDDVALNTLFGFLNWSLKVDGRTDFTFDFIQQGSTQTLKVNLQGEHDGIGLFKNPGEIHGTIAGNLKELDLSGLRITSGGGHVRLLNGSRAFIEKDGSGRLRLPMEARNLSAGLLVFYGNVEMAGSWNGKSVPDAQRETSLDVFARSLWVNQYYLDGNITRLNLKKGAVVFSPIPGSGQKLSGELIFKDFPKMQVNKFRLSERGIEKIFLDGEIGRGVWDYKLHLKDIDAGLIFSLMDRSLPISGPMDVNARAKGSYEQPEIEADVVWKNGEIYGIPLDTAQGTVYYKNSELAVDKILVKKKNGYELTGFIRPDEINFRIEDGDLQFLSEMTPEISKARGNFEGFLKSKIQNGQWNSEGRVLLQKIDMRTHHIPNIDNGVVELTLKDDELKLLQAEMDSGEARIVCEGKIMLEGLQPKKLDINLKTIGRKGLMMRVPELAIKPGPVLGRLGAWGRKLAGISQGEALLDLSITGAADAPSVVGNIQFSKTTFTYPPTKSKSAQSTSFSKWARGYISGINWDLTLSALSRAWFQNELVNAALTGKIQFVGKVGALDINGRFDGEQGSIVYSGNEFSIKQATLEIETKEDRFTPNKTEKNNYVYLRATAEREVFYSDSLSSNNQDVIVMVVDRSLLGEIQPRFYSKNNPNLSSQKALQLALGLPLSGSIEEGLLLPDQRAAEQEKSRAENDKFLRAGLIQLLDSSLASPLARALVQNTGLVDFVRVTYQDFDPLARDEFNPTGESSNDVTQNQFLKYAKGTKVKFGRGISRRLSADYSFRVDEYQEKLDLRHEVELAYRLQKSLFLRGITELDSERTLGRPPDRRAILENQWRFGLPRKKQSKQIN